MNRNLRDLSNLFRKNLTLPRLHNALKVFSSYYVSRMIRKPVHWGKPISFSIEPTTSCNLRCPQCPSGLRSFSRPTGMIEQDIFESAVNSLYRTSGYMTFYFQGEPYLHPRFSEMVSFASEKKIYTATSTNAHFLSRENAEKTVKSGLDRLIISIDGCDQETYAKYRTGGKLNKVLEGTRELMQAKKRLNSGTPHVIWQFIVFAHNEHQLDMIKELAGEFEVDELAVKTAQVYDYETGNSLIPTQDKYSRYKKVQDGYRLNAGLLNHCWRLWNSCVITWDGSVVPCCFDKDASNKLGSLKENSFESVWKGPAYKKFRGSLLKGRKNIDICRNCSEGVSVWKN